MKVLLVALNAKYIHSNLAVHSIQQYCGADEIEILECTINQDDDVILFDIFQKQAELILFSCYIWNIEKILLITKHLKKICPDCLIGLGGPEVSYDGENLLRAYTHIDYILSGEGEKTVNGLLRQEDIRNICGIIYRDQGKIKVNAPQDYLSLDDIPFIYNHCNLENFKNRILYYETSRGCPYGCSYCISSIDRKVRFLSLERVFKDLQFFLEKKVKQVKLVDRTFNCQEERAAKIWAYLIRNDNGVTNFHFEINALTLPNESIAVLKAARPGLFQLEVGVQSTAQDTLAAIHRPKDVKTVFAQVKKIALHNNIHQHLDLIAGLPLESFDTFKQSFNDVYGIKPHQLQLGFLKVLKGSLLHRQAAEYGIVYRENAPYEVLYTKNIRYEELNFLKNVESLVERYYNGGLTPYSLDYAIKKFSSPFSFYEGFANHWLEKGYFQFQHNKLEYYRILFEFMQAEKLLDSLFLELLKYDLLLNDNIKQAQFLHFIQDKERIKICREIAVKNWPEIDKSFHKMSRIEFFTWDVLAYAQNGIGQKETIAVLFDYRRRDKLTNKATVYRCGQGDEE